MAQVGVKERVFADGRASFPLSPTRCRGCDVFLVGFVLSFYLWLASLAFLRACLLACLLAVLPENAGFVEVGRDVTSDARAREEVERVGGWGKREKL